RQAERQQQQGAGEDDEHDSRPRAPAVAVDPERQVEHDPGAAGHAEQREDEADERGIDAEPRRDASAHAREHAVGLAALEAWRRHHQPPARTTSTLPAPTVAWICSVPRPVWTAALRPSSWWLSA